MQLSPTENRVYVPAGLVRILNRDLEAAGIRKRDDRGRTLDVHALRATFGSLLSQAGVPLRTAQAALRHSDPSLTANVYTDPGLLDVSGVVESLPELPLDDAPNTEHQRKAGTMNSGAVSVAPTVAPNVGNFGHRLPTTDTRGDAGTSAGSATGDAVSAGFVDSKRTSAHADNGGETGRYRTRTPPQYPGKNRRFATRRCRIRCSRRTRSAHRLRFAACNRLLAHAPRCGPEENPGMLSSAARQLLTYCRVGQLPRLPVRARAAFAGGPCSAEGLGSERRVARTMLALHALRRIDGRTDS